MEPATIHGPEPVVLGGREGVRYWIHHPFPFTGDVLVDHCLSGYPLLVFAPPDRPAAETPVVLALQGMAAPLQWNDFVVSTLGEMKIACALFDIPLAGERSLARNFRGDIVSEVAPLIERRVRVRPKLVPHFFEAVRRDFRTVRDILAERHGLIDERLALFGVSLGALLSSLVFARDGIGERLYCAIGHSDLPGFARSYAPSLMGVLTSLPGRTLGKLIGWFSPTVRAAVDGLIVLRELMADGETTALANPMNYLDRIGPGRPARFLIGDCDLRVKVEDAQEVARRFPDGKCYVVPGMDHGGPGFAEHASYYLATQLGDWRP